VLHFPRRCTKVPASVRYLGVILALLILILALPGAARGGEYTWSGIIRYSPPAGNGNCVWYTSSSACSGWNYWYQLNATHTGTGSGTVLAGFQNNNTIRGSYLYPEDSIITYPSNYSMCCYLKSHVTICSWYPECLELGDGADMWFKTWA
jgi:hypothetical protein